MPELPIEIPGATALRDWFGYWPSFHDAEVLGIHLNRTGTSFVRIHTWEMTGAVNALGQYACTKHVIVSFLFERVSGLHLDGFNHQNVIDGVALTPLTERFEFMMEDCYGVSGTLVAGQVRIELEPGIPGDSIYPREETSDTGN